MVWAKYSLFEALDSLGSRSQLLPSAAATDLRGTLHLSTFLIGGASSTKFVSLFPRSPWRTKITAATWLSDEGLVASNS